jgi:hypothetical protein
MCVPCRQGDRKDHEWPEDIVKTGEKTKLGSAGYISIFARSDLRAAALKHSLAGTWRHCGEIAWTRTLRARAKFWT